MAKKKGNYHFSQSWLEPRLFTFQLFGLPRASPGKVQKKVVKGEGEVLTRDQLLTKFVPRSDTGRCPLPSWGVTRTCTRPGGL